MNDLGSIKITDVAVNVGGLQVLHDVNISASKGGPTGSARPKRCWQDNYPAHHARPGEAG